MNKNISAFDESASKAKVIQMHGHEQPVIEDGYMDSLMIRQGIDFADYAEKRETEKDNIKPVSSFYDEVLKKITGGNEIDGATMPWIKTHDNLRFRGGEVTMWHGYSGHKKSMVLGYISLGFINQNEPVCIASLEMKPASTIERLVKQAVGTKTPTSHGLDLFVKFCDKKLWIYDKQGTITPQDLYGVIYYSADILGVKHFVIDSLMRVVPKEDDYNAQKDFVTRLCDIAMETNVHIHLVHHNRKGDEDHAAGSQGAKGTGAIKDNVHNAIEVWNKFKAPEKKKERDESPEVPDTYLICTKQRNGEWEGAIGLWFDESSLQFFGSQNSGQRTWLR